MTDGAAPAEGAGESPFFPFPISAMTSRYLIPSLALLAAALHAQDAPQPEQDEKEARFSVGIERLPGEDGEKSVLSLDFQGLNEEDGESIDSKLQFDFSVLEKPVQVDDVPPVTFDSARNQFVESIRFHTECMRDLRTLALAPKVTAAEVQSMTDAHLKRFTELVRETARVAEAMKQQGVKLEDDPEYARLMGVYRRVTYEQAVEWHMLIRDLQQSDDVSGVFACMAVKLGIGNAELSRQDLDRQMQELSMRVAMALRNLHDMLNIINSAASADALADMLAERARDAEKYCLLSELYLNEVPAEISASYQALTIDLLRKCVADPMKRLRKADYFGSERLKQLVERYDWLQKKDRGSYNLSINLNDDDDNDDESETKSEPKPQSVKTEVIMKYAKDPATGKEVSRGVSISVQKGSPAEQAADTAEQPAAPADQPVEEPVEPPVAEQPAAPAEQPVEEPAEQPVAEQPAAPAEQPVEEPVEQPVAE